MRLDLGGGCGEGEETDFAYDWLRESKRTLSFGAFPWQHTEPGDRRARGGG